MAEPAPKQTSEPTAEPTAKLFMHGRSQAVRLPKAFRLPGKEVRVRRIGNGVLLEPIETDLRAEFDGWLARIDAIGGPDFPMPDEPPMPADPAPIFEFDDEPDDERSVASREATPVGAGDE